MKRTKKAGPNYNVYGWIFISLAFLLYIIFTIEQNRCAMVCQGCGAVLFLLKKQWNYFQ